MRSTTQLLEDTLWTGTVATAATTAAASLCGRIEEGQPIAPLNAVSHIVWGDEAAAHETPSMKYTMPGVLLNTAAVTGWAGVYELLFGGRRRPANLAGAILGGAAVSALAYVTDYYVVPDRVTPGFEKRLSNKSLAGIYTTLAVSLGVGSWLRNTSRRNA
jgi:hypothetical protein